MPSPSAGRAGGSGAPQLRRSRGRRQAARNRRSYVNKWVSLSASLTALLGSGLSYAFALYAGDLKEKFGYSQKQTDGVAASMNLGGYLGVPAGLLYDFLLRKGYRRAGPRIVMVLGALLSSGGYLSLWRLEALASSSSSSSPSSPSVPFALVCLSAFFAANGAAYLDCSALATAVRNHRGAQRGGTVGALKAAVGLSGSLFATADLALFPGDAPRFLLFLAAAPLVLAVGASAFVNVVPFEQDDEVGGVVVETRRGAAVAPSSSPSSSAAAAAAAASPATMATTAASSASSSLDLLPPSARVATSAGVLLLLALYSTGATLVLRGPGGEPAALTREARLSLSLGLAGVAAGLALLPSRGSGFWARRATAPSGFFDAVEAGDGAENGGAGGEGDDSRSGSESEEGEIEGGDAREELEQPLLLPERESLLPPSPPPPPPVLRDPSFWLLFVACASGAAAGLSFINNAAQIASSAGLGAESTPVLVSAFSVANCVGRLVFGSLSEKALHSSGGKVPRPLALAAAGLMAAAASAALAVSESAEPPLPPPWPPVNGPSSPSSSLLLPAVAACAGAAFGGMWTVMAASAADLFGVRRYASTYALLQVSSF